MASVSQAGHHYYHVPRLQELRRLYWAHTVKELAGAMVSIFVPIYLYRLHYSITTIFAYFLLISVFWGLTQAPILRWSQRIGFNRSMGVSLIVQSLQMILLASLPHFQWPLWLIAAVEGISYGLYWPQFRASFTRSLLHRKIGPAAGMSSALLMLALGIAPAFGGLVASGLGIGALYVVSILCFVAAAVPLFMGAEVVKDEEFHLRDVPWRSAWRDLVSNMGSEVDADIAATVWPLLIFFLLPSYAGVGVLSSTMVVASIIIALYVSRRQLRKMTGYLKNGSSVVAFANAVRLVAQSVSFVAGINFFYGLGQALITTPFYSRYYHNAEREASLLSYLYAMMIACAIADIALFGLLLLLTLVLPVKVVLVIGLIMAVPAGYAIRLMRG